MLNASTVKLAKAKEQPNNTVAIQDAETALNRILEEFHVFSKDWENLSKHLALSRDESIIAVSYILSAPSPDARKLHIYLT